MASGVVGGGGGAGGSSVGAATVATTTSTTKTTGADSVKDGAVDFAAKRDGLRKALAAVFASNDAATFKAGVCVCE